MFKPQGTLKNSGGCDKRQLGGDSRYRLNHRPASSQREQGNNTRWEELSWGQKKCQTLTSETTPSIEPEFNRISL